MDPINTDQYIRPINIKRDLGAIADLIETAFAGQMDAEGHDYLRHIRQIARSIGGYLIDGSTPETSQFPFHGYLWEEDGRIIGNLTLIPVRKARVRTYFIANVAVLPEYRGRGIARRLTDRALTHVQEHKGRLVYLQVRVDNLAARHIYETSGFEQFACRTNWIVNRGSLSLPAVESSVRVTRRVKTDWLQQRDWLNSLYPPEIAWNLPISMDRLKPDLWGSITNFLNGISNRSWSARQHNRLIGLASWESGLTGTDYVWLATSPVWENTAISALLPTLFAKVFQPQRITINYPAGRAVDAFKACGMHELNTLIWMKKEMPLDIQVH